MSPTSSNGITLADVEKVMEACRRQLGESVDRRFSAGAVGTLLGLYIHTSPYLVTQESRQVPRTWRERLFSRPWQPWVGAKTISVEVPSKQILNVGNSMLICHPEMLKAIRKTYGVTHEGS